MSEHLWHHDDRGQDVVEYALVLPFLTLLLLGIVDVSLAIWHYDTVANVGREVARCGIIFDLDTETHINQCIQDSIDMWGLGLNLSPADIQADIVTDPDAGKVIRVQVDYEYQPITGLLTDSTIGFHTESTMRTEYP
jgi:hypothetical protein